VKRSGSGGVGAEEGRRCAVLSGDVLFGGSVGRTDLPGGDWATLEGSIGRLLQAFDPETTVYPGHMRATTLGLERDTNPFLAELRSTRTPAAAPNPAAAGSLALTRSKRPSA